MIGAVAVLTFTSCSRAPVQIMDTPDSLSGFYEHMHETLAVYNLPDLRTYKSARNEIQIRVWELNSWLPLPAVTVIQKKGKRTHAEHIIHGWNFPIPEPKIASKRTVLQPRTNWEDFWSAMEEYDILTTQGDLEKVHIHDAGGYLVEVNHRRQYRAYSSNAPRLQKSSHAKKLTYMFQQVKTELGIEPVEQAFRKRLEDQREQAKKHNNTIEETSR